MREREMTDGANDQVRKVPLVNIQLQLIGILRALAEVAGMFLLAQGALFLLAGRKREGNFVYQLFRVVTRPVLSTARLLLPKAISDAAIPFFSFVVLFGLWILLAYARQVVCRANGLDCG